MAYLPKTRVFFEMAVGVTSMYFLTPHIAQKFLKIQKADPELWVYIFFGPKWSIGQNSTFLGKSIKFWSIYCSSSLSKIWRKWLE